MDRREGDPITTWHALTVLLRRHPIVSGFVVALTVAGLAFWVPLEIQLNANRKTRDEGRAQVCDLFIRQHEEKRQSLIGTRKYLRSVAGTPRARDPFTVLIRANVRKIKDEISATAPPKICDPYRKT